MARTKKCEQCSAEFEAYGSTTKYCSKKCREARNAAQKRAKTVPLHEKRINRIPDNTNWCWGIAECKRAGTVEIFTDVDLELLFSLREQFHKTYSFDPAAGSSYFNMCHIASVKGDDTIGLLHHQNLFIGRARHNQQFQARSYEGHGLSIRVEDLDPRFLVDPEESKEEIAEKLIEFLGDKLVEYAKSNSIDTGKKVSLARKIKNAGKTCYTLAELESMSTAELQGIVEQITNKPTYQSNKQRTATLIVNLSEIRRLSENLPHVQFLEPYFLLACVYMNSIGERGYHSIADGIYQCSLPAFEMPFDKDLSAFRDWITYTAFEAFQGKPIVEEDFKRTFSGYLLIDDTPDALLNKLESISHTPAGAAIFEAILNTHYAESVVREIATQHSSNPSATRAAGISATSNSNNIEDMQQWRSNRISRVDSQNTCKNTASIICQTEMANDLEQVQMRNIKAA